MMYRRQLMAGLGAATLAVPLPARAQQAGRLPVVAFVLAAAPMAEIAGPDPAFPLARVFVHGLRDLDWVDGRNVIIERRSAEGDPQHAPAIFDQLVAQGVNVLAVGATRWLLDPALKATRKIPIVSIFSEDPVIDGLVASLARPGGNLTGVTSTTGPHLVAKRLELLKELAPGRTRVAFLGTRQAWDTYRSEAGAEVPPVFAHVDRPEQIDEAFATVLREHADALFVSNSPVIYTHRARVVEFATQNRLPTTYNWREAVDEGGLMSYGSSTPDRFRQMAGLVDRILRGAKPADLPVEQPTKFELVINARTAKALDLIIPPTLLALADEVIE